MITIGFNVIPLFILVAVALIGFIAALAYRNRYQSMGVRPRGHGWGICIAVLAMAALSVVSVLTLRSSGGPVVRSSQHQWMTSDVSVMPGPLPLPSPTGVVVQLPDIDPPTTQKSPTGKLWVDDWQRFRNSSPPGKSWIRADSAGYFATDDKALQSAFDQAVPLIEAQITDRSVPQSIRRQQIVAALRAGNGLVPDQYIERVNRPYGALWRCSLLIDLTPARARQIMSSSSALARAGSREQMTIWASALGMFLVLILTYFFLNAATKGYFVWKLRAAMVMMLIVTLLLFYGNLRI